MADIDLKAILDDGEVPIRSGENLTGVALSAAVLDASAEGRTALIADKVGTQLDQADLELVSLAPFPVSRFGAAGDGVTDDTAAIQAAIDAAAAAHCTVSLAPGKQYVVSTLDIDGVTDLTVLGATGAALVTESNALVVKVQDSTRVTIKGLSIIGASDPANGSQTGIAITGTGNTDISVIECHIDGMGYDGVYALSGCDGLLVANCIIENCGDDGINPGGHETEDGTTGARVIGNLVRNNGGDGIHVSDSSRGTTVVGNVIEGCTNGISLYRSTGVTIGGNVIRNPTAYGICTVQTNTSHFVIDGNVVEGGTQGIRISFGSTRYSITGNILRDPSAYGIVLSNPSVADAHAQIDGNVITGSMSGAAIEMFQVNHLKVTGNTIAITAPNGIRYNTVTDLLIAGNQINGTFSGNAISFGGSAQAVDLGIVDNAIGATCQRAINVNAIRPHITGNRIAAATTHGIVVSHGSLVTTGGVVSDNQISGGCSTFGIQLFNQAGIVVAGNRITGIAGTSIQGGGSADYLVVIGNLVNTALGEILGANSITDNNLVHAP